jgi:ribosomal protein L18E
MCREERLKARNEKIRVLFKKLTEKNPKYRSDAVIEDVADELFLSKRTVEAILKGEGIYSY